MSHFYLSPTVFNGNHYPYMEYLYTITVFLLTVLSSFHRTQERKIPNDQSSLFPYHQPSDLQVFFYHSDQSKFMALFFSLRETDRVARSLSWIFPTSKIPLTQQKVIKLQFLFLISRILFFSEDLTTISFLWKLALPLLFYSFILFFF